MRSLDSVDRIEVGDEKLVGLTTGVFYLVTRQRNAWRGTVSRQYKGPTSLSTTLDEAKLVAERWRAQGSSFTIQELPGLVIETGNRRIGMVEFHTESSFGAWDRDGRQLLKKGTTLAKALHSLESRRRWVPGRPRSGSFVLGQLDEADIPVSVKPSTKFKAWSSWFPGGFYPISWAAHDGRYVPDGVLAIRRAFVAINRRRPELKPTANEPTQA